MKAWELADKIADYLCENKRRSPMSVIMMERRGQMSDADTRDALIHIYREYGYSEEVVKIACRK